MTIYNVVRKNTYYDSVTLMLISKQLKQIEGVDAVSVMMGTPANRVILDEADLLSEEGKAAGPNDLILAFRGAQDIDVPWVCKQIDEQMAQKTTSTASATKHVLRTSAQAYQENQNANLAFISVPGEYAVIEAYRALQQGKHVFLFSDNVSLGEEAFLKRTAAEKGLFVMGPDCGTAIINGVGIGFANKIRTGNVGIAAASGTGLQEVACLLHELGLGISQAIGTGGRDLKEEIGAATMMQALDYLLADEHTGTVILVSKPPAKPVAERILEKLSGSDKKIVLCFIGYQADNLPQGISVASTLEEAALQAARLNGVTTAIVNNEETLQAWADKARAAFAGSQHLVRALYAGGTLCYEAMLIANQELGPIYSNIPLAKELAITDVLTAGQHSAIDLGDDEFTKGRPHPMIDGSLRNEYILKVAADAETAVLLLDVVIGYGAAADPAGDLAPVLEAARAQAKAQGNQLAIVAYVCGTNQDEQNKDEQIAKLTAAGALVAKTNAEAARLASRIVKGLGAEQRGGK